MGCCCFEIVETSEIGVVETFGRFYKLSGAGFVPLIFPWRYMAGKISLRMQELKFSCDSKTADNVFVEVECCVQYQVSPEYAYAAFYRIKNPQKFLKSLALDAVRATLTRMTMDELFESQDNFSHSIRDTLHTAMTPYGFTVRHMLLTRILPARVVREALNVAKAAQRLRIAAGARAEMEKILTVTAAQGSCEEAYLHGVGTARQRAAILMGMRESILEGDTLGDGSSYDALLEIQIITQYLNTIQTVSRDSTCSRQFIER